MHVYFLMLPSMQQRRRRQTIQTHRNCLQSFNAGAASLVARFHPFFNFHSEIFRVHCAGIVWFLLHTSTFDYNTISVAVSKAYLHFIRLFILDVFFPVPKDFMAVAQCLL